MLFTTSRFIFFLLGVILIYQLLPQKFRWIWLLLASYIFYCFSGIKHLIYITVTSLSTYLASIMLDKLQKEQASYLKENKESLSREERKAYKAAMKSRQRRWLVLCMLLNFGILAVLKYTDFMIANINGILDIAGSQKHLAFMNFALPLGISFYTFQTMGYLIDVYREKYPVEKNPFKLALFTSFFPQLIQGPINRFDELKGSLFAGRNLTIKNVSFGAQRILWGFFKKLVIADRLLVAVTTIIRNPDEYQGVYVLVGMFFYAITLYADFTGGIDIAIGVAEIFGIPFRENFERPFFSKSIAEYWRRWHMSLSSWFRDYMFYPISVSKPMLDLSKLCRKHLGDWLGKRIPIYLASIIVWFTTGIWHGSAWNFIVWGLLNCLVILVSQECTPLYEKFHNRFKVGNSFWFRMFQVLRTFWLMNFLRTLDCYQNVGLTFRMYSTIFTRFNLMELFQGGLMRLGLSLQDYIVLFFAVCLLLIVSLAGRRGSVREQIAAKPVMVRYLAYFAIFLAVLILGAYGVGYDSSQFIYSRF